MRVADLRKIVGAASSQREMSQCAIWQARALRWHCRRTRRLVMEKGAKAAQARPKPPPENDCRSGCSPPFEVSSPTAKSPEESSQKCAAGRDAVANCKTSRIGL